MHLWALLRAWGQTGVNLGWIPSGNRRRDGLGLIVTGVVVGGIGLLVGLFKPSGDAALAVMLGLACALVGWWLVRHP